MLGRTFRVTDQAEAEARDDLADVGRLQVRSASGDEIYGSAADFDDAISGVAEWKPFFGGMMTHVALRPEAAERLVIGGLPRSRLPLLMGVLAMLQHPSRRWAWGRFVLVSPSENPSFTLYITSFRLPATLVNLGVLLPSLMGLLLGAGSLVGAREQGMRSRWWRGTWPTGRAGSSSSSGAGCTMPTTTSRTTAYRATGPGTTVRPLSPTVHAKPVRGAKSFRSAQ